MKNSIFYRNFLLLFVALSLIIYFLQNILKMEQIHEKVWYLQTFFFFISIISHMISSIGIKRSGELHIFYMASMGVRMLFSMVFIFACVYFFQEKPFFLVVNFFILYLVYTSFEIYFLLRTLRPDLNRDGTVTK